MFQQILFYVFSALVVASGAMVITIRNPVYAALSLVVAFFASAGLWMMLEAEFLAIALVLVYVGAVMVLFLFVVMMLDINLDRMREGFWSYLPLGATVGLLMIVEMVLVLSGRYFGLAAMPAPPDPGKAYRNTRELGRVLYTDYIYAFELAGVVLLVAIIAAIALTLRRRKDTKGQDPSRQVAVKRADRVRIVSMPSEKND
jgi:NADH-quinone oxidoreductase subunit J